MSKEIVNDAKSLCEKFINKVETGRARSSETYAECKALLAKIEATQQNVQRTEKPLAQNSEKNN